MRAASSMRSSLATRAGCVRCSGRVMRVRAPPQFGGSSRPPPILPTPVLYAASPSHAVSAVIYRPSALSSPPFPYCRPPRASVFTRCIAAGRALGQSPRVRPLISSTSYLTAWPSSTSPLSGAPNPSPSHVHKSGHAPASSPHPFLHSALVPPPPVPRTCTHHANRPPSAQPSCEKAARRPRAAASHTPFPSHLRLAASLHLSPRRCCRMLYHPVHRPRCRSISPALSHSSSRVPSPTSLPSSQPHPPRSYLPYRSPRRL